MHLSESADLNDSGMINAVNDGNALVMCWRGWPRVINTVQMEDMHGYDYQFRSIPSLDDKKNSHPTMMVWTLCSILSTVKEMWHAVDKKLNPFHTR